MSNYIVPPKFGRAVRLPDRVGTTDIQHCLVPILYSPQTSIVALAHVYDLSGSDRYSGDRVIDSLLEDMTRIDSGVLSFPLRAHLVGELDESLAKPENRTNRVSSALKQRGIPIVNRIVGGLSRKNVYIHDGPPRLFVQEYLEDCVQRYGEFHAEREHWLNQ